LVAADDLSGILQQRGQYLKGLLLESHTQAPFAKFTAVEVNLKDAESHGPPG
jgi:hypothetical protein